jgi:2-C-methyl-D-erythritol 4-phosphate cytidylyltransferase
MIYAQIMAGGIGKRMGNTSLPKQFLMLGNKPIIIHTVEKFTLNNEFELILVSIPKEWMEYTKEIFDKYQIQDDRVRIIAGGAERNDTLVNAIHFIEKNMGLSNDDILVTHDAVRPFITKRIINDNIEALKIYKAVDTVVPAYDTIVRGDNKEILEIPVRNEMYQGQTPQSFNIKSFQASFTKLTEDDKKTLTDSCKIVLLAGEKVGLVYGEQSNIKITTPFDLKIANSLLGR